MTEYGMELYDAEAEKNSCWCDRCGSYHGSAHCPPEPEQDDEETTPLEHDILITVNGGVAQIATAPQQAQIYIFDFDNYKQASAEERAEMLDELPEHLRRLINE